MLMKSWDPRKPLDFIHSSKQGDGLESMLSVMTNPDPFRDAYFIIPPIYRHFLLCLNTVQTAASSSTFRDTRAGIRDLNELP